MPLATTDTRSSNELTPHNRDSLSAEDNAIVGHPDSDDASTGGSLIGDELVTADFILPVGTESTVGRARNRIFIDSRSRREKPGNEIEFFCRGTACNNNTEYLQFT